MGNLLENVHAWFDEHAGTKKFVKGLSMWVVTYLVANQAGILATLPPDKLAIGGAIFGGLAWCLNFMQSNTEWPIVGARKK